MKKLVVALLPAMLLTAFAQKPPLSAKTVMLAELARSLDAKKAKSGDPVEAKTTMDVLSQGKIVMPRNTRIIGHVISAKAYRKESPDSQIEITFDRAIVKDGMELPLTLLVQAIGIPISSISISEAPSTGERYPNSVNLSECWVLRK